MKGLIADHYEKELKYNHPSHTHRYTDTHTNTHTFYFTVNDYYLGQKIQCQQQHIMNQVMCYTV